MRPSISALSVETILMKSAARVTLFRGRETEGTRRTGIRDERGADGDGAGGLRGGDGPRRGTRGRRAGRGRRGRVVLVCRLIQKTSRKDGILKLGPALADNSDYISNSVKKKLVSQINEISRP